jgi:hypothetical protein
MEEPSYLLCPARDYPEPRSRDPLAGNMNIDNLMLVSIRKITHPPIQ